MGSEIASVCRDLDLPVTVTERGSGPLKGALGGVIGSMMALEAVKVITGAGEPLIGRVKLPYLQVEALRERPSRRPSGSAPVPPLS